jgi:general secretion pathway protein E
MDKKEELTVLAEKIGLSIETDLLNYRFIKEQIHQIPYSFAKEHSLLPLDEKEGTLLVALHNPFDVEALEKLRHLTGLPIEELLCSKTTIDEAIEVCYRQKKDTASLLIATLHEKSEDKIQQEKEGYDLLEPSPDSPVIQILNAMLSEAILQGASDIHFEPVESGLNVRYRIDGVLQMRHAPPKEYHQQLLTRIKVMSQLDIAERRLPQDGRIKLHMGERQIDFRVSTVPVVFGERIVMRILDKSNILLGMSKLGMRPSTLEKFHSMIRLKEGIVLVTGPTGSGKTTTLYSALSAINTSEVNVMTIEDPVEYKLQGMAQIGVNPKIQLTFATGLRHILRQDPDVIMIGEIRDRETAEIAIQAALTGHLVLTTLHTNDAPAALTRLHEMGIEPYLLTSSVIGVLAQRLVRTICLHCKESYEPSEKELLEIKTASFSAKQFYRGRGCPLCFQTGYKGRHGIYELMNASAEIKTQLLCSSDSAALRKIALSTGMISLREDGFFLSESGITTLQEVLRVTRGYEEA